MISLLSGLNYGEERIPVGPRQTDSHRKNIDPTFGMRMTWGIRTIDEEMLGDTIVESSGRVDSGRSNLYRSYSSSPQIATSIPSSLRNSTRVCSHCGTSKTPLWRSGPRGPKSLCNACGIRLKKAGRRNAKNDLLIAASLPSFGMSSKSSGRTVPHDQARHVSKKSRLSITKKVAEESSEMENVCDSTVPQNVVPQYPRRHDAAHELAQIKSSLARFHEKRKLAAGINLSSAAAGDEEEGAILLMALSYGYVNA